MEFKFLSVNTSLLPPGCLPTKSAGTKSLPKRQTENLGEARMELLTKSLLGGGERPRPSHQAWRRQGFPPRCGQVLELLCSGTRLLLWDGQCGHRGAGNKVRGTCPRCDSHRTCVSAYWTERVALGRVLSLSEPHLLPGRKRKGSEMGPKRLDL